MGYDCLSRVPVAFTVSQELLWLRKDDSSGN
jgi:hypothetical protein